MTTRTPSHFGALLRALRTAAGLTQEALAERARLSKRGLQGLERGVLQTPHRDTVELFATALGLGAADRAALFATARPQPGTVARPDHAPLFAGDALVPLAGRERELELLDRFLAGERTPPGPASVLLLAGEPGIGKTRLLQATAVRAIARGWCVLVGGCQRRGGQEPYAPLLEALAHHLQAAGPVERRAALAGCAWLARLLPELAEDLEPPRTGILAPEQERRLIHAAVARLLANVAGPAGALLVLDDLQWAGPDALDLIRRTGTKRRRTDGCGSGKRPACGSGLRRWRWRRRHWGTGGTAVRARRTRRRASRAAAASARVSSETVCLARPDRVAAWGRTRS